MPTMIPSDLGLPTIEGKAAFGESSPENPALHIPDPLSITTPCDSSSDISYYFRFYGFLNYISYFLNVYFKNGKIIKNIKKAKN